MSTVLLAAAYQPDPSSGSFIGKLFNVSNVDVNKMFVNMVLATVAAGFIYNSFIPFQSRSSPLKKSKRTVTAIRNVSTQTNSEDEGGGDLLDFDTLDDVSMQDMQEIETP
jgi:hypothetical protein